LPAVAGRASALEIFPTLDVERVTVVDRIGTAVLPTRAGPLQVVGLPWIRRSQYLAREDTRDLTLDEITLRLEERLTDALRLELESLDPRLPAVLVAHVTVGGATLGTERSMMLGRDHVLQLSNLASPRLDYLALGHIHKHQVLGQQPITAYAGSLQRVDFSEEKEEKGFCLVELDPARPPGQRLASFQFVPVHARPFVTVDAEVHPGDDPTDRVLAAIARKDVAGAIARVRIRVPEELERGLDEAALRAALSDAHYVSGIHRDVLRATRTRIAPEASRGLTPREALRLYLQTRDTPPDRAEILLRHADTLLQEELSGEPTPTE
ncbi:MAG: hypothetical protein HY680_01810, partial [Chloroflexi bacterium]|nr:hypothetical protein [Chloroflexota bacterium]